MSEKNLASRFRKNNREYIKVKTSKKRNISSTRWLDRQLNDPYYQLSKIEGYRSRSAYKLIEINEKYKIFKPGQLVIDLGAAPGGWSQVVYENVVSKKCKGKILAIDKLAIEPLHGIDILQKDFLDSDILERVKVLIGTEVDIILSDMAPATCGDITTDHLRILNLCEIAFEFSRQMLKLDGTLIMKIFIGGVENNLLNDVKKFFKVVKHFKPNSSRKESKEIFLIAQNYQGNKND